MDWYSKSRISTTAAILEDYGLSNSIWLIIAPTVKKIQNLAGADKCVDINNIEEKFGGSILDLFHNEMPPELTQLLDEGDYQWEVEFAQNYGVFAFRAAYRPLSNLLYLKFNTALPLEMSMSTIHNSSGNAWKAQKTYYMRSISRMPLSIRHEINHLLRDAQTGHLKEWAKKANDPVVQQYYDSHGYQELEFEIDAEIAALNSLRQQLGEKRFDKLTPQRIQEFIPGFEDIQQNTAALARWVKRLMREGLLTRGMKEAWNLK